MRIGFNPVYKNKIISSKYNHRVIIPIYIDEGSSYFSQSFEIFKLSLASFQKTKSEFTAITVVVNGYNQHLIDYLNNELDNNKIDSLFINRMNIGKINAILQVARTTIEEYITVSDSDVVVHFGWEKNVFDCFKFFPEALSVSPIYIPEISFVSSISTIVRGFFRNTILSKLNYTNYGIDDFFKSIGRSPNSNTGIFIRSNINTDFYAGLGGPHFCYTVHNSVFKNGPSGHSLILLGAKDEYKFVDGVVDAMGGYRISTVLPFVQHMGNSLENFKLFKSEKYPINLDSSVSDYISGLPKRKPRKVLFFCFFRRLLSNKKFRHLLIPLFLKELSKDL